MPFCIDCAESLQEGYNDSKYRIIATTNSQGKLQNIAWDSKLELMDLKKKIEANFDPTSKETVVHRRA